MWTLIIYTVLLAGYAGGMSSSAIPGFSSRSACEKTGHELVTKSTKTEYFYGKKETSFFGKDTSKLHSTTLEGTSYGYQCIEVK